MNLYALQELDPRREKLYRLETITDDDGARTIVIYRGMREVMSVRYAG
jgi:hypothetical protein